MKSKTMWYICLVMILFGGALMDLVNQIVGTVVFGMFAYLAGGYQLKSRLEELNEPRD